MKKRIQLFILVLAGLLSLGCSSHPVRYVKYGFTYSGDLPTSLWLRAAYFPKKGYRIVVTLTIHDANWSDVSVSAPPEYKLVNDSSEPPQDKTYEYVTTAPGTVSSTFHLQWHPNIHPASVSVD